MKGSKTTVATLLNLVLMVSLTLALPAPALAQGPGGDGAAPPATAAGGVPATGEQEVAPATEPPGLDCNNPPPGLKNRLVAGFRGKPAADVEALVDALVRVSQLAVDLRGQIAALDINPMMVLPEGEGVRAVDTLVEVVSSGLP